MGKTIRASLVFDYYVDDDELMAEMSEEDQFHYVRESVVQDIVEMNFGTSDLLYECVEIEVIND